MHEKKPQTPTSQDLHWKASSFSEQTIRPDEQNLTEKYNPASIRK